MPSHRFDWIALQNCSLRRHNCQEVFAGKASLFDKMLDYIRSHDPALLLAWDQGIGLGNSKTAVQSTYLLFELHDKGRSHTSPHTSALTRVSAYPKINSHQINSDRAQ